MHQFTNICLPGKRINSWVLQSVVQVSSMESERTLLVPEMSVNIFWHTGCPKDTSRKLHINFQISTFLESSPTPGFSRVSSKRHPWNLRGHWWFLTGVILIFDIMDVPRIHQGRSISFFRSLPSWEVLHLLCVSRMSSWSLRGRWRFLRGVLVDFEMVDALRTHPGRFISNFKSLPSWKVVQLLGSPECHPSVLLGVYEDTGGFWEKFWWFLTWWMPPYKTTNIQ